MANAAPAKVVYTGTTGPGQSVTAQTFTDVTDVEYDFVKNIIAVTRAGAGGKVYYDYSASTTVTQVITAGATVITVT
jgi:oxalate decarboxylase/phosphoglucose isomerase-like protein (cupin superfamily)